MNLTDPSTLCLFLLVIVVLGLMFRTRVKLAGQRRRSAEEETGQIVASDGRPEATSPRDVAGGDGERALSDDLTRWEVHLHETARELSAQLDAKLSLLQSLTAEADRAAQRLEEALQQASSTCLLEENAPSLLPGGDDEPDATARDASEAVERPGQSDGTSRSQRREDIYHLADYGFSPVEIARRVGSPVGEVELILSLRGK